MRRDRMGLAGVIRYVALAVLWGSNFLLIAVALDGYSPLQVLAGRLLLGAAVLVPTVMLSHGRLPIDRAAWGHLAVAAVVANAVPYYLFAWAEQSIPSSVAGSLNATTPLFTFALAAAVLRDSTRATLSRMAGVVVGFGGVLVILQPWSAAAVDIAGSLAALGASASYAIGYVYQRRYLTNRTATPLALAAGQLTAAAILTLPVVFVDSAPMLTHVAPTAGLLALGVLGTGAAYVLNYRLIADHGPTVASTVLYLLPVVAVVLGVAVLDDPLTAGVVAGTALVLAGVTLAR